MNTGRVKGSRTRGRGGFRGRSVRRVWRPGNGPDKGPWWGVRGVWRVVLGPMRVVEEPLRV